MLRFRIAVGMLVGVTIAVVGAGAAQGKARGGVGVIGNNLILRPDAGGSVIVNGVNDGEYWDQTQAALSAMQARNQQLEQQNARLELDFQRQQQRLCTSVGSTPLYTLQNETAPTNCVVVTHDNTRLFSCASSGLITMWDLTVRPPVAIGSITGHTGAIRALIQSRNSSVLFSGSIASLYVWNLNVQPPLVHTFNTSALSLVLTSDDETLYSGSTAGSVWVWTNAAQHPTKAKELIQSVGPVLSLVLSSDELRLFISSIDGTLAVWNTSIPHEPIFLHWLQDSGAAISALALTPNAQTLFAVVGSDIVVWNTTHAPTPQHTISNAHTTTVYDLAVSSNGDRLYSASGDLTVGVWDLTQASPSLVTRLNGHTDHVLGLTMAHSDDWLITCSADFSVRIWPAVC
eukprot:m.179905 g.179905  ORF g.179905 m.179905 type:complete len:402 (+) comp14651_c1_seq1:4620-5825(+)